MSGLYQSQIEVMFPTRSYGDRACLECNGDSKNRSQPVFKLMFARLCLACKPHRRSHAATLPRPLSFWILLFLMSLFMMYRNRSSISPCSRNRSIFQ